MNLITGQYVTYLEVQEVQAAIEHTIHMMDGCWKLNTLNLLDVVLKIKVEVVKFLNSNITECNRKIPIGIIQLKNTKYMLMSMVDNNLVFFDILNHDNESDTIKVSYVDVEESIFQIW